MAGGLPSVTMSPRLLMPDLKSGNSDLYFFLSTARSLVLEIVIFANRRRSAPFQAAASIPLGDGNESAVVDWIWQRYGHFRGVELSNMTHEPGTPWYNIAKRQNFVVPKYFEMSDDENRTYFTDLARREGII